MPQHFEEATATPNVPRDLRPLKERLPHEGRLLSDARLAELRERCEVMGHTLMVTSSTSATCDVCGATFTLTEDPAE